jgi:CBS domain-containing protein
MRDITIKELIIRIEEYATVSESATLYDAILALQEAQKDFDPNRHKHRAVLVLDSEGNVVGKIAMFDILMALEPKYGEIEDIEGYNPELIQTILEDNLLWIEPLQLICDRAPNIQVGDFMEVPADGVFIIQEASLGEAIHQLIMCRYHSLLVTEEKKVIGILRLSDVFTKICDEIGSKACKP